MPKWTLHYFALLGLHVLVMIFIQVEADSETSDNCKQHIREASDVYYSNKEYRKISSDDLMGLQHGKCLGHKRQFLKQNLHRKNKDHCLLHSDCLRGSSGRPKRQTDDCNPEPITCNSTHRYRTADGSCNNLDNPYWGKADRRQARLLPNAYNDDIGKPRTVGCNGNPLPSPRHISNIVHSAITTDNGDIEFERQFSYFVMQWGQFVAHDVVLTPIAADELMLNLDCCGEDAENAECFTIDVPDNDTRFTPGGCMNFSRSQVEHDCNGVRQQINLQSSYIDASQIYGSSLEDQANLRTFSGGLLKMNNKKLPVDFDDSTCNLDRPLDEDNYYCALAGDVRVMEQPGLSAIHTLFSRMHNYLATGLTAVNPHWNETDERLYQEARRIVGAIVQMITYRDFLPTVVGYFHPLMKQIRLSGRRVLVKDTYDPTVDATIFNSFGAAFLRFGHSLIHRIVGRINETYHNLGAELLGDNFFHPEMYHENGELGLEYILRWTSTTKCPMADRGIENSVRNELYKDTFGESFDLAAFNIQRGRDHGLPSYNRFREYVRLPVATHFGIDEGGLVDHTADNAALLEKAYACPDDIDVFTGALSERRAPGAMVGPLHQLLILKQFQFLRDGDRFFFERNDTTASFTIEQLAQIRSISLSSIICAVTSSLKVQKNVFFHPSFSERISKFSLVGCDSLPQIDLEYWKETE